MTVDEMLAALRAEMHDLAQGRLPVVVTYKRAAFELSVGLTKLRAMIKAGHIQTCELMDRRGIPSSEIYRIAGAKTAVRPPPRGGGRRAAPKYDAKAEAEKLTAALKADRKKRR